MSKPTYWDMLRDPRWQKKRLEIMARDEFRCSDCCDDKTTLNVHHTYYAKGRKPWEYEDDSLVTLCEPCHEERTGHLAVVQRAFGVLSPYHTDRVLGYLRGLAASESWPTSAANIRPNSPRVKIESDDMLEGLANALEISYARASALVRNDSTFGAEEYAEAVHQEIAEQKAVAEFEARGVL